MDVSCPQCRTEYEFEDARIPDDGLTVKCTQCSHVFRMKKKAPPTVPTAADEGREWRLRQPTGNVFTFKHLTTLQKWIVERKVQKQDEISLTGDGWKRLGDIAELASFFQVVDDAVRLAAAANQPRLTVEPPAAPDPVTQRSRAPDTLPPEAPIKPRLTDTLPAPGFSTAVIPPPAPPRPEPPAPISNDTIRGLRGDLGPPPAPVAPPPAPLQAPRRQSAGPVRSAYRQMDDDDIKLQGQGGALKWVALALIILGGGGAGAYWFVNTYQPEQVRLATEAEQARAAAAKVKADQEREAAQKKLEEAAAKARADQEAAAIAAAAAKRDAGPGEVDAGAVVDAGVPKAAPRPMDFDQLLQAGERLRAKDKAEAALAMFTRAAELKPDRVEPQTGGGFCMLDLEKPEQAEQAFREALNLNPRYGPALIGMAESLKALGKKAQAVVFYQKYLDVLPNGPEAEVAKNSIERLK